MNYSKASDFIFSGKTNNLKKIVENQYVNARFLNDNNLIKLLEINKNAKLVDLGCDDGNFTIYLANKIKTKNIYGVDVITKRLELAHKRGIKTIKFDLNKKFLLDDNFFDVVCANQVIEHLTDIDNFVEEIYRILKPNGYALISTENASSWSNIFASIMGWQIFSLTNFSRKKWGLGNPLALHRGEKGEFHFWTHKTILNIRGLKELFNLYNFKVEAVKGAGYFPLPSILGNIDKTHSHFLTFKIRKKK